MTYVVTEDCIKCKYTTCVDVCPVDCFYEGENMLVINPEQCIDCGVCEPECPIDAIQADTVEASEKWVEHNKKYASLWPNIRLQKDPPQDADQWHKAPNKLAQHFSENPGTGTPKV